MAYREGTAVVCENKDLNVNQFSIKDDLRVIAGMIGEAYSATAAVMRYMFGDTPTQENRKDEPSCFTAELMRTKDQAAELVELCTTLAKLIGA